MFVRVLRAVVSPRGVEPAAARLSPMLDELRRDPGLYNAFLARRPLPDGRDELLLVEHWTSPAARMAWVEREGGRRAQPVLPSAYETSAMAYEVLDVADGGATV